MDTQAQKEENQKCYPKLATALELGANYDTYSPDKMVADIKVPLLIVSTKNDSWVGDNAGSALFKLANDPKQYWQANTSHDVFADDPNGLKKQVLEFLNNYAN